MEEQPSNSTSTSATEPSPPVTPERAVMPTGRQNARLVAQQKLKALTLEEKVSLLTAADFWRTKAIPENGIPAIKTSDGPNGARGEVFVGGTKAALFPCGISLAATWNKHLLYEVGLHLAEETKARSANMLLAPTVCMHRHPLGGRNFESFSEDPLLTGKLAARYIEGLQARGVAATIKHFVGNEQETERNTIDTIVSERALREIYLRPFEIAVREANPWAVMTSYNKVNGVHADMHNYLLKEILRGEWKYDGTVISDWGGTNSIVESVQAGCDIEFPHSTKWRLDKLVEAAKEGKIDIEDIDRAAENALTLVQSLKGSELSWTAREQAEKENDSGELRQFIRWVGHEGLTLLKNEGDTLPICPDTTRVAVIGPNANRPIAGGGGSARLNPYYNTIPLDSIRRVAKEVTFAHGCHIHKWLPLASDYCTNRNGHPGVDIDWFTGDKFEAPQKSIEHRTSTELFLWDSAPLELVGPEWSARIRTSLMPTTTGKHTLSFMSVGPGKLFVDQELKVDLWNWTEEGEAMFDGSVDHLVDIDMEAGKAVELCVEITNELRPKSKQEQLGITHKYGGCRVGFKQEDKKDYLQEAIEAARAADVAVVIVGLDAEWESEGYDRQTMDLPVNGSQDRLVEAVVKANPRTIVVNQSGSPVHMPWVDEVPAILQGWYQGQEAGNALADVLFGLANPSGKLPATFPERIEHTPAYHNWPGENGQATYGEGLYIGYRHYDRTVTRPLFPFGHGLSYTKFEYGRPEIRSASPAQNRTIKMTSDGPVKITLAVSNIGDREGAEIVQVYVRDEKSRLPRPEKELVAFEKVFLEVGETKHISIKLDKYAVGYYDTSLPAWIAEEGKFEVLIGASSADIRRTTSLEVEESFTWVF